VESLSLWFGLLAVVLTVSALISGIVDRALTRLEELQKAGALKVPPALSQRLASVEIESGDPSLRRRAAELRKAIR